MGDRCYIRIMCLKKDLEKFDEIILGNKKGWNHFYDEVEFRGNMAECVTLEANYGFYSELEECHEKGLVFIAENDSGGTYSGGLTLSFKDKFIEVPYSEEGYPYIEIKSPETKLEDLKDEFQKIIDALKLRDEIMIYFDEQNNKEESLK